MPSYLGRTMTASARPSDPVTRRLLVERVRADCDRLAGATVREAVDSIPDYTEIGTGDVLPATRDLFDRLLAALSNSREPGPADLSTFTAYGELRAQQHISLESVMRAWRMAQRHLLDEFSLAAPTVGADDHLLLGLTLDTLDLFDTAIVMLSAGHRGVELRRTGRDGQQRADFTRAALTGTLHLTELHQRAEHYGLDPKQGYRTFRTRPTASVSAAELETLLGPTALVTVIDGDLAGIRHARPDLDAAVPIAFGPAAPLAQLADSFRLATRALATALALGHNDVQDFDDLGLLPGVITDPGLGTALARRYLTPLGHGEAANVLIDTVEIYLDSGLRIDTTAQRLFVHPNTVRYRIGRFEDLTACDLHRARRRISASGNGTAVDHATARPMVQAFVDAASSGRTEQLVALLTDDATGVSDGAGLAGQLIRYLFPEQIARAFRAGLKPTPAKRRLAGGSPAIHAGVVNGCPAMLATLDNRVLGVVILALRDDRIASVHGIANAARLARLTEQWQLQEHDSPLIESW
ncbi:hypothetical protein GL305_08405 [Nocardia seriolae]|nr:hypothetical protein [Nocardia seriolae]MTJ76380.1 hypothetical protein [Nocardia seriolae]MTJ86039.1 hypothetical protein [Nocardia seriolae]MTK30034.1 hypothetical protein [Nocardia seriolae]MTK44038.1 hypothetical protein [Nocardia seriolae]